MPENVWRENKEKLDIVELEIESINAGIEELNKI